MKHRTLFIFLLSAICTTPLHAQFTIPAVGPTRIAAVPMKDSLGSTEISNDFFSKALWRAQRRAARKEHNTIEFNLLLAATQTQFINWQAGGDNTFSARTGMMFHHLYKKSKFSFDYRIDARFGMNLIDDCLFKNEDEFKINAISSWTMHRDWSYAASVNLRSQFATGYKSRSDKTKISNFMAPGFFDVAIGFNYKKEGSPWNITLSPIAGSIVTVLDEDLRQKGMNGVPPGAKTKGQLGPSVRVFFDKEFGKKVFRYRFNIYSFSNIKTPPTLRWENILDIRATKFLTTSIYGLVYYDKYSGTNEPQYNYSLSIGLSYWIKNK